MCETGRILHHLKNNITSPKNTVLIVGFQAAHTLGRRLVEGHKKAKIFGEVYEVRAEVAVINGFSSHADMEELDETLQPQAERCRMAFVVHGEDEQAEALAGRMREMGYSSVRVPVLGESVEIW